MWSAKRLTQRLRQRTAESAILFADVVSSTMLYEEQGDVVARRVIGSCIGILSRTVAEYSGAVVKHLGDGILCSFDSAGAAVRAATAMRERADATDLQLRVGVHRGPVLRDGDDIFGDAVNTAARITALAKPSEILISRDVAEELPEYVRGALRPMTPISVKGKRRPLELFAVQRTATDEGQTTFIPAQSRMPSRLELTYAGQRIVLDPREGLTIGRDPASGITVSSRGASRAHARIFHRQGKFLVADESANGTYLVPQNQAGIHLVREEAILHGRGRIYLGWDPQSAHGARDSGAEDAEPVHYSSL